MTSLKVAVFGDSAVGKSALTVRFLTKRYIGEYNSDIDLLYRSSIRQVESTTDIEILDTCSRKGNEQLDSQVQWADGFIVVYDICRKSTVEVARTILASLHRKKSPFIMPILLLGNKLDLDRRREIGIEEGHELALEFNCQFYEVSAAEAFMPISIAFQSLLRDAKTIQQQRSTILRRRKSSLMTVSKKLGSFFGKKESDLDKKRPSDFALSF